MRGSSILHSGKRNNQKNTCFNVQIKNVETGIIYEIEATTRKIVVALLLMKFSKYIKTEKIPSGNSNQ